MLTYSPPCRVLDVGTSRRNLEVQEKEVMASTWIDINSIESVKGPCRVVSTLDDVYLSIYSSIYRRRLGYL